MQVLCSAPRAGLAFQATKSEKFIPPAPQGISFKLPKLGLGAAGVAMLASSVLVLTPLTANAAPTLTFTSPDERDQAMDFQCKGGMFDCDGDRRDFAKQQYQNFVARMETGDQAQAPAPDAPTSTDETANKN